MKNSESKGGLPQELEMALDEVNCYGQMCVVQLSAGRGADEIRKLFLEAVVKLESLIKKLIEEGRSDLKDILDYCGIMRHSHPLQE